MWIDRRPLKATWKDIIEVYERTTKSYSPFQLIYTEKCENRIAARSREKFLKSGIGKEFLKKLRDE